MAYLLSLNSQAGRQAMLYRLLTAAEILTGETEPGGGPLGGPDA